MTENYVRIELKITEFETEDVITTSGIGGGDNPGGDNPGGDNPGGGTGGYTPGAVGEDYFPVI